MSQTPPPENQTEYIKLQRQLRRTRLLLFAVIIVLLLASGAAAGVYFLELDVPLPRLPVAQADLTPTPELASPTPLSQPIIHIENDDVILPADGLSRYTVQFSVSNLPDGSAPFVRLDGAGTLASENATRRGDQWQIETIAAATAGESSITIDVRDASGLNILAAETVRITTYHEPLQIEIFNQPQDDYLRLAAGENMILRARLTRTDGQAIEGQYQLLAGFDQYETAELNGEEQQQAVDFEDNEAELVLTAPTRATLETRDLTLSVRNQNIPPYRMTIESIAPLEQINIVAGDEPLQQLLRQDEDVSAQTNMTIQALNLRDEAAPGYPLRFLLEPVQTVAAAPPQVSINGEVIPEGGLIIRTNEAGQLDLTLESTAGGGIVQLRIEEAFLENDVLTRSEPFITGVTYSRVSIAMPRDAVDWQTERAVTIGEDSYFGFLYDLNGGRRVVENYEVLVLDAPEAGRVPVLARFRVPLEYFNQDDLILPSLEALRRAENLRYVPATVDNISEYYPPPNPMAILATTGRTLPALYNAPDTELIRIAGSGDDIEVAVLYAAGTMSTEALLDLE